VGAIVSILPGGLGTFEMAMILGFAGLGAPKPVAVAATLVYRVLATWLPAVPGVLVSGELTASRE
jgi:phosphatidylglycerol lysyltransferase